MTLCGQLYVGYEMLVVPCTRCQYWKRTRCAIETGAEHLPAVVDVPTCPIQARCQHQIQAGSEPCAVRARGMVCESAFVFTGMSRADAMAHPLSYHADTVATVEDLLETEP